MKNKKQFLDMVRDNTKTKHDFMIFTPDKKEVYRDDKFRPISI